MAAVEVKSEVTGTVWKILVKAGDRVSADDELMILESMKMEIPVPAPAGGTVRELRVAEGDSVAEGDCVAVIDAG
jgi:acetyl-CoA carboxylase biotin carboxyl carrier protein